MALPALGDVECWVNVLMVSWGLAVGGENRRTRPEAADGIASTDPGARGSGVPGDRAVVRIVRRYGASSSKVREVGPVRPHSRRA